MKSRIVWRTAARGADKAISEQLKRGVGGFLAGLPTPSDELAWLALVVRAAFARRLARGALAVAAARASGLLILAAVGTVLRFGG